MEHGAITFWMTVAGTLCWGVCFVWMHQISARQDALLQKLQEQGKRIEAMSRLEHELIKEVHPQVSEIKEQLDEVAQTVSERAAS